MGDGDARWLDRPEGAAVRVAVPAGFEAAVRSLHAGEQARFAPPEGTGGSAGRRGWLEGELRKSGLGTRKFPDLLSNLKQT